MIKNKHNFISIMVVLLFGVILFFVGTDGFQAFTEETARTNRLMEEQPKFPEVMLEDSKERVYSFSEFEDKYVMITFVYTACSSVCPQLEMNLAEVYNAIPSKYIGEDIVFLSISFDPERDDPTALAKYQTFFGSDGETWRMARITDQNELDALLDEFGVIVIPEDDGEFTHNSAFYLANRDGYLTEVMDYTKTEEAAAKVTSILEEDLE
ncbi:SCO family protein [Virgibacillus sp. W0181]|uniref:SCO family protein n=1 Tax=Virgibacillus sp. W0181 TaxID=3391581 RepID=UPI003F463D6F